MPSRISITLLICLIGAAIAVGALFLPPREAAAPPPAVPAATNPAVADPAAAPAAGPIQVSIEAFRFTETGAIAPGQEILVVNNDSVPHTLTADDGSFDTGFLQPGEQALITAPAQAGEFTFFCEVHPSMTGAFTVAA